MEQNKFFKYLWRINAIGLFLMLCTGIFTFVQHQIEKSDRRDRMQPEPISSLAEDPKGVEKWVLKNNMQIEGSSYKMLSLVSEYSKVKAQDRAYYATTNNVMEYNNRMAKNILFLNQKNNHSSWLFKTNNQLILECRSLTEGGNAPYYIMTNGKNPKAQLIYYTLINKDTNGDKIITTKDKKSFAVSKISSEDYKVIISDMEQIISVGYTEENNSMSLVYQKDGMAYALSFDIEKFEVIDNVGLPKVGEKI